MAQLVILDTAGEPKGNMHLCQWCQAPIKGDRVFLGRGPSGALYLVCPTCKDKA